LACLPRKREKASQGRREDSERGVLVRGVKGRGTAGLHLTIKGRGKILTGNKKDRSDSTKNGQKKWSHC